MTENLLKCRNLTFAEMFYNQPINHIILNSVNPESGVSFPIKSVLDSEYSTDRFVDPPVIDLSKKQLHGPSFNIEVGLFIKNYGAGILIFSSLLIGSILAYRSYKLKIENEIKSAENLKRKNMPDNIN